MRPRVEIEAEADQFGAWLNAQLIERGMTQEQLARQLEVSLSSVSRWRRGAGLPSYVESALLYEALGTLPFLADPA